MGPMLPPVSKNWQLIYLDLKKFYKFLTKLLSDLRLVCVFTSHKRNKYGHHWYYVLNKLFAELKVLL
jgi:hypothetical protein